MDAYVHVTVSCVRDCCNPGVGYISHTPTGKYYTSMYNSYFLNGNNDNESGMLRNIEYPHESHLKQTSRENSSAHNLFISHPIVLKFCIEHYGDTDVFCTKFQNDWTTETRFREIWVNNEFQTDIAQHPCIPPPPQYCDTEMWNWTHKRHPSWLSYMDPFTSPSAKIDPVITVPSYDNLLVF